MHTQIPLLKAYIPISIDKLLFFQLKMAKQMSFNGENSSTKAYTHISVYKVFFQYKMAIQTSFSGYNSSTKSMHASSTKGIHTHS